ncbi:MAG: polysaccharide deacetylase family protein [Bacteroidia bacterium]
MKISIFLLHRVSPEKDPLWNPISPERFDAIVARICKKYSVVSLENIILGGNTGEYQKPLAAIVFDDGYRDFLEYALPILKKHKCPSSIYVVTDCVTGQRPPWTYILDHHFLHSKKQDLELDTSLLPEALKKTKFGSTEEKLAFASAFKLYLKKIPNAKRLSLLHQALGSLNDTAIPDNLMLNWNELGLISKENVEIGSHSVSHPLLAQLESETELEREIRDSGMIIQQKLGAFPKAISYPIGSVDQKVKAVAKKCGYQLGLAVDQQFYDSNVHDRFEIPRVELYSQSMLKTNLRISGLTPKFNRLFKK